jgi:dTDP-4-amino-4,6-dideoxygalactose transaminase
LDGAHVIPCANGTDALQIALMALELEQGDEVIVPSFTFVASVEVIALLGLKPIVVDVDERTFLMKLDNIQDSLSPRTACDYSRSFIRAVCQYESIDGIGESHAIW